MSKAHDDRRYYPQNPLGRMWADFILHALYTKASVPLMLGENFARAEEPLISLARLSRLGRMGAQTLAGLQFFTHIVDGEAYGAWYRVISPTEIEVIGVGLLETADFGGFSPDSVARSVFENFIRLRARMGVPIPSVGSSSTTSISAEPSVGMESSGPAPDTSGTSRA